MSGTYNLTPEEAHDLVLAALEVATSPSAAVLKRCRAGAGSSNPVVESNKLGKLADVLDKIQPGIIDRVYRT